MIARTLRRISSRRSGASPSPPRSIRADQAPRGTDRSRGERVTRYLSDLCLRLARRVQHRRRLEPRNTIRPRRGTAARVDVRNPVVARLRRACITDNSTSREQSPRRNTGMRTSRTLPGAIAIAGLVLAVAIAGCGNPGGLRDRGTSTDPGVVPSSRGRRPLACTAGSARTDRRRRVGARDEGVQNQSRPRPPGCLRRRQAGRDPRWDRDQHRQIQTSAPSTSLMVRFRTAASTSATRPASRPSTRTTHGILHTESTTPEPNTLGQFFIEWGVALDRLVCRRILPSRDRSPSTSTVSRTRGTRRTSCSPTSSRSRS